MKCIFLSIIPEQHIHPRVRKGFAKKDSGSVNGSFLGSVSGSVARHQLHPNTPVRKTSHSSQMSHSNSYR